MGVSTAADDIYWMLQALAQARYAAKVNEVPVGAVLVKNNTIVGRGYNQPIKSHDPTAHAEIIALRNAAMTAANYRLLNTALYVTLEPCAMCAGALIQARVKRIVFGAGDSRNGACGTVFNIAQSGQLNHRIEVTGGLLADECGELLRQFFRQRR